MERKSNTKIIQDAKDINESAGKKSSNLDQENPNKIVLNPGYHQPEEGHLETSWGSYQKKDGHNWLRPAACSWDQKQQAVKRTMAPAEVRAG